jgi:uncharacterized SAM-binding protein YcdF (DUF218 family)
MRREVATGAVVGALVGFCARDLDLVTLVSYWYDRTPHVLLLAAVGALAWPTRLRRPFAAVAGAVVLLWLLAGFTPLSRALAAGLPRRDAVGPADAVFVLSSDVQDDGELTSTAMSRLVHGLEQIGEGHTARLIVSELPPPKRSYAAAARVLVKDLALHAEVFAVGPVYNTHQEAVQVAALCRAHGWRRLIVVTSPLHSRRASAALEREGMEVMSAPAQETRYDLESQDRADARLMTFGAAIHERVGLWIYRRRGWI